MPLLRRAIVAASFIASFGVRVARAQTLVPPKLVAESRAEYPEGAQGAATVELEVFVDVDGAVRDVKVVDGAAPFVTPALISAAKDRFTPAMRDGAPIAARVRLRIHFEPPVPVETPLFQAPAPKPPELPSSPATPPADIPPSPIAPSNATPPPGKAPLEVTIEGQRNLPDKEPAKTTIDTRSVQRLPGAFGDAFRSIEILPGVVPFASGLPYFFVRGAMPSSTGYFFDGIRIPFLYHVAAGPSVINPAIVDKVDFYPAGYPAELGRFVGGVVSASAREPSPTYRAEAEIRLVDAGAFVEAPFADGKGDAFVGGRYSYTAGLLKIAAPTLRLDYGDYQAGASYAINSKDRVRLLGFGSFDHLGKVDFDGADERTLFDTSFQRVQLKLEHRPKDPTAARADVAIAFGVDHSEVSQEGSISTPSFSIRSSASVPLHPTLTVRAGADMTIERYSFDAFASDSSQDPSVTNQVLTSFTTRTRSTTGAWVDLVWKPTSWIEIVPGARFDVYAESSAAQLAADPRASIRVLVAPRVTSVTTFGIAHQWPSLLVPVPGLEPALQDGGLQRVVSESQGFEVALPAKISASVTGYHQFYGDLTDLLATCSAKETTCLLSSRADGSSIGLEMMVSRSLAENVGGFVSYTLSRSERTFDGDTFVSDLDRTHVLNVALGWAFLPGWHAGARVTAYSGRPYSLLSFDDAQNAKDPVLVGRRNALRRDWFYRIDARIERSWTIGRRGWVSLIIEGLNVTLQKETIDFDCRIAGFSGDTSGLKCGGEEIGPIFIPSIGLAGGFR